MNIFKVLNRFFKRRVKNIIKVDLKARNRKVSEHFYTPNRRPIGKFGLSLLLIPLTSFYLGTWQVRRKKWKDNLVATLKERTNSEPVTLPATLSEINRLEYYPVRVKGEFLNNKEIYIGPRSLLVDGDGTTNASLISSARSTQGYLVITPFELTDRSQTILINRGWVPINKLNPHSRKSGQVEGPCEVVGVVRLTEKRPVFMPSNRLNGQIWLYRDLELMSEATGSAPIFLDAKYNHHETSDGPIPGQTRIAMRNEHMGYILTWYGLSFGTSYMWYLHFIK